MTKNLTINRVYTTEGTHPYDTVEWEKRDVEQLNWKTGEVVFKQNEVEFPTFWSANASTIVTTKYFRGALDTEARETSLKEVIDRVVDTYTEAAIDGKYMTKASAQIFNDELKYMLVHQYFSFNSPVWFNVGTKSPQQVSACFILSVDDSMDSILNWYREEGFIFKGGSGAGLNLSKIRSSRELLSSGGNASGPVSFMRGADASAGTIKSGGATRRAAKMVVLDVDHPDIEEFIETKANEENKIRVLRDAGFDMDLGGKDIVSVQYQNANNSVRVSDEFMRAVENHGTFNLKSRTNGETIETVNATELFNKIAKAAWECADPGLQYDDTINNWHTNPATGRITASNPCSEYLSLDNSSCNLASLNLMKFRQNDGTFNTELFIKTVELVITAMEISIHFADFPTDPIGETTRNYRQLGIGYANLGALLMANGLAYDSAEGRSLSAAITSVLTGVSYRRSAEIAGIVGPYNGYETNKEGHDRVMEKHLDYARRLHQVVKGEDAEFVTKNVVAVNPLAVPIAEAAEKEWENNKKIGKRNGWRNAQASVLAPTGTIGFMMDVDTTGVEPDFALLKFKKLVGGGSMQIVNQQVERGLDHLGYDKQQIELIQEHIKEHGHVNGAPELDPSHYNVFDCAVGDERQIEAMGHVRMMAAVQPFLSGAISKTVNLPESATQEDIADIYMQSWRLGLKATAVYRDNCKVGQPLSNSKPAQKVVEEAIQEAVAEIKTPEPIIKIVERPRREKLPRKRTAETTSFTVGGAEGYLTVGKYDDGRAGEIFLKMAKQGSTLAGMMEAFSVVTSIALQYGVPLETLTAKFVNQRFEPSGFSDDPDVRMPQSIIDYVFRRLALDHLPYDVRTQYGVYTTEERNNAVNNGGYENTEVRQDEIAAPANKKTTTNETPEELDNAVNQAVEKATQEWERQQQETRTATNKTEDKPLCATCETEVGMQRAGACWICALCGSSTGCS